MKDFAGIGAVEEGRPAFTVPHPPTPSSAYYIGIDEDDVDEKDMPPAEEEQDKVSLYGSTQSKTWQDVLVEAAHSVKSGSAR